MTVIRLVASGLVLFAIAACASTSTPVTTAVESLPPRSASASLKQESQPVPAPSPAPSTAPTDAPPAATEIEAAPAPAPASPPVVAKSEPAKRMPKPVKPPVASSPALAVKPVASAKATGATLAGKLELVAAGREGIVAGEIADGLVYFLPKSGGARPKPGTYNVDTRSKGFSPSVLVVPVGSTVRFPNRDSILHNVFSRTPGSSFDSGFYGPGQVKQQVFSKPGLVIVNCNVHHNMRADIVVLATPYYTRPDRNGRYKLDGLPAGGGTLVFWHPRAQAQSVQVSLPMQGAVTRKLSATKPSRHDVTAGR